MYVLSCEFPRQCSCNSDCCENLKSDMKMVNFCDLYTEVQGCIVYTEH